MSTDTYIDDVETDETAASLAGRRLVVALILSAAMVAIYFTFMGLFAFNKPLLGTILCAGPVALHPARAGRDPEFLRALP